MLFIDQRKIQFIWKNNCYPLQWKRFITNSSAVKWMAILDFYKSKN